MLNVFMSYAGDDAPAVRSLMRDVEASGLCVLPRDELVGDEAWWAAVLEQILNCEVLVFAVSDSSFRSKRCRAEVDYGRALGVPIVPVQVGAVGNYRIDGLFDAPIVDHRSPDSGAGMALAVALHRQAAARTELPDPLPSPPPFPYERLQKVDALIDSAAVLSRDEQSMIVNELAEGLA
jgi:hypothetical protein